MEINLFTDQWFASFLPTGSVTLIKYGSRFMGIPLGVFAVAFSTILLPHFTRVSLSNPERLSFYLLECSKFVFWVTIPATCIMMFLSYDIFLTLFASSSSKFPPHLIAPAGNLLAGFLCGLFFFSLNKILLSLHYSLHDTKYPMIIAVIATALNVGFNYIFMNLFGIVGLALATSLSGAVQVALSLFFLKQAHKLDLHVTDFTTFMGRYIAQMIAVGIPSYFVYRYTRASMESIFADGWGNFFMLKSFGYWLWATPLIVLCFYALYKTREYFGVKLYFLD